MSRTNAWDSQNRLASCTVGNTVSSYTYGADGLRRRAFTAQPGQPIHHGPATQGLTADDPELDTALDLGTSYAYDGTMLVREGHARSVNGVSSLQPANVTATYLIGARGPEYRRDDTAQETDTQGNPVTKASWYVYDGLGSVVGEVDPAGNLTSSPKYDVYGAVRSNGGSATSKQGFVGGLGHVSDTETGLVYMRARYYDPALGRFASEDPSHDGMNWFAYCNDDPVNETDSDGKSVGPAALFFLFIEFFTHSVGYDLPPSVKDTLEGASMLWTGAELFCLGMAGIAGASMFPVLLCALGGAMFIAGMGKLVGVLMGENGGGAMLSSPMAIASPAIAAIYGQELLTSVMSDSVGQDT